MKTKILLFFFASLLLLYANAYAMTLDQALELPGVSILNDNIYINGFPKPGSNVVKTIIGNHGLPAFIVDHGVTNDCPKVSFEFGNKKIKLTPNNWNLVYQAEKPKDKDRRFWINPEPIMPGEFSLYCGVVFYTSAGVTSEDSKQLLPIYQKIFSNKKALSLIANCKDSPSDNPLAEYEKLLPKIYKMIPGLKGLTRKLSDEDLAEMLIGLPIDESLQEWLLESRSLSSVVAVFNSPVSLGTISTRFGDDYEKAVNKDMDNVYRYVVYSEDTNKFSKFVLKKTLYIDFIVDSYYATGFEAHGEGIFQEKPTLDNVTSAHEPEVSQ